MGDARDPAERMAQILAKHGMQRMAARVLCALLFAEDETVTAGELADRLGASPGSVSSSLKLLAPMGLVERAPVPGSRREHYRLPGDAWPTLMSSRNATLRELLEAARDGVAAVGEESVAGRRVAEMRDFYDYMLTRLPELLDEWQRDRGGA